jgi:integrase
MLTYDVRIWGIRERDSKSAPYQLRWRVGSEVHPQPFRTKTAADGRRAELLSALRRGEQFDTETGLPASELRERNSPTWYAHACAYALMKWPRAAAKHRASIAETLTTVTPVLVTDTKDAPHPDVLRMALHNWAFRIIRTEDGEFIARKDAEEAPQDISRALSWIAKHSLKLINLADTTHLRNALNALSLRLDGRQAADNTIRRKRTVLSNALRYAVERDLLAANPLSRIDWEPPPTDDEVNFEFVPEPRQAQDLIQAVREQGKRGEHLYALFGCLYYAAMRPSEAAALTRRNCKLPATGWGELVLTSSRPEVGSGWTDDGKPYEERGLKRRARKATRSIPIPPVLVHMLRDHLDTYGTAEDGRLFRATRGGRIRSTEYTEVWQRAREKALPAEDIATPLADVPYALRHAGISLWIKARVDPVEVARRAGHSVAVLYRFYAKLLRGQQHHANQLIDTALTNQAP